MPNTKEETKDTERVLMARKTLEDNSIHFKEIENLPLQDLIAYIADIHHKKLTKKHLKECDKIIDIFMKYLEDSGKYHVGAPRPWIDILYAATYIHYLTFDPKNPVLSMYTVRQNIFKDMTPESTFLNCTYSQMSWLCDTLECAMGPKSVVTKCAPVPNSPQQVWSDAIWFYHNFCK